MSALLLAASLALLAAASPAVPTDRKPSATPRSTEVRFLALGDSFTAGTGSTQEQSFPARLAEQWRASGRKVALKNLGVNGYTTQRLLEVELPEVAGFQPTFVTLAIGANDIVHKSTEGDYRAQVKRILQGLAGAGMPPAALVAIPQPDWSLSPAASSFGKPEELRARIQRFNAILREEVEAAGGRYVDLFPLMRKQAEAGMVAPDGLHPNARAYGEWADSLAQQLKPR